MKARDIHVDPDALRTHANSITDLADRVQAAADAAKYLSGLDDAYGIFAGPFVGALMSDAQEPGAKAIEDVAKALLGISTRLRANADSFEGRDDANRKNIERGGEDLKRLDPGHRSAEDHSAGGS
ncbi:hypothetical protein IU485_20835 [Nocardia cyriacigeorgica]|uniref:type VII secretion target n=1 Tax=Nocardia cyriacigeorgica TaxID=135487 RepID=UPI0018949BD9|nr:type VII secretion target [Nocardia cyriacigeorgica]MBF6083821.1 hypothetical protein [Nocardia cyriacigeorgica]